MPAPPLSGAVRCDLNSDLGEGFGAWSLGDDEALLDLVTSANVACGFHAGDPSTMRRVVAAAAARGVAVGAQVSYPDLVGFGRRRMDVAPDELTADVLYQVGALDGVCRAAGARVRYVKPHGALYNRVADDDEQAAAVVAAVASYGRGLPLLGLPGSAVERAAADAGVPFVAEAFADRAVTADGRLVPRGQPGAVLTDVDAVARRAVRLVVDGRVTAAGGAEVEAGAASVCVHGDTPGAVAMARAVRAALEAAGVELRPFA
jgi:5-oxoprolinase (ATP-hydrolysing) subunit A